jgi:RNA-directed DNA polymerase
VLEPIFEADLPPEIYAYRGGRNAQQAVVEVEELRNPARLAGKRL